MSEKPFRSMLLSRSRSPHAGAHWAARSASGSRRIRASSSRCRYMLSFQDGSIVLLGIKGRTPGEKLRLMLTKKCNWARIIFGPQQKPDPDTKKWGWLDYSTGRLRRNDAFHRRNAPNRNSSCAVVIHGRYARHMRQKDGRMAPSDTMAGFVGCKVGGQHASLMYVGMIREIFNIDTDDQVEAVVPVFRTAGLVTLPWIARQVFCCDPVWGSETRNGQSIFGRSKFHNGLSGRNNCPQITGL